MNIDYMLMGPCRFRGGGGGGGGGGGDGGDSGGDSGPSMGDTATGTNSDGDTTSVGPDGVTVSADAPAPSDTSGPSGGSPSNGIAGLLGVSNPTLANLINKGLGVAASAALGPIGGIAVGMGNAAINGNSGQAASSIGSGIGAGIAGPVGAAIGSVAGNAIGNMPGTPASGVPSDPSGGGSGIGERAGWTATPEMAGRGTLSGGLGLPGAPGSKTLAGEDSQLYDPSVGVPGNSGGDPRVDAILKALRKSASSPGFAWN